jgi:polysaccharide export outer membrane protein
MGFDMIRVFNTRRFARFLVLSTFVLLMPYAAAQTQPTNYSIGPQDILTVAVFDQPNLSGKFTVEIDGTFTLPLIGRVKVAGLSLREVESQLRHELEQGYLKNPQVSVAVDQYRSQQVFVVGEVRTAGAYPLSGEMTLIEVLARAGSTTERASGEAVIVRTPPGGSTTGPRLPGENDSSQVVRVNIKELQSGRLAQNIALHDGDTIFVPRAESVYVFGQVRNPGAYPLESDMTVLQALTLAGGVTDRGATNRIRLVRVVNGNQRDVKVKLDDRVRAGETIVVPERFF